PRPPNSWILYRSDTIKKIKDAKTRGEEFPGDVSKMISLLWKNESKEVRLRYDKLSAVRKAEHARLYPNYKYQPQRK
ncbi:hypothetical protein BDY24DRAFT_331342, partial [Mrakia frigida]|uniref:HMG-box domain-containing protein n=1 Tax=Mrakia frigida TaxID=29902 RepID=UPI003FCC1593